MKMSLLDEVKKLAYSKRLSKPVRRSEFVVEEFNKDGYILWDVCESIEEADSLIKAIRLKKFPLMARYGVSFERKTPSPIRFRITRIDYEGDKKVSSEIVKKMTA